MKMVLVATGSAGDVHPFFAFGRILRERGHDVVLFTAAEFAEGAAHAGLRFEELLSRERFDLLMEDPRVWDSKKAFPFLMREGVLPVLRDGIDKIRAETAGSRAVLAGSSISLAARTVRELDGTPMATIHMSPAPLRTLYRMPVFEGLSVVNILPRWAKRGFWWLADRVLDPQYVPQLNEVRADLGLPELHRPLDGWWDSPDRVLGLWPEWFGPVQPDFPPTLHLVGFPFGGDAHKPLDPGLNSWLDDEEGGPPLVFTHGSANVQAAAFFDVSVRVAEALGRRALLVTRNVEDVSGSLPEWARHATYAPFGAILPRATALVSHGGIGTVAEGLRAGVPQLVVPIAHDQYDNASRLKELGVARSVPLPRYTAKAAIVALNDLIKGDAALRAASLAERLEKGDGASQVADQLEALGNTA